MRGAWSKLTHTARHEGVRSLLNRSLRYAAYRLRRAAMDTRAERERWARLRGKFEGRRAFLIGNGPSLNQTPLYLLDDEYTLCCNRWDLMLERLTWTPTFYTVIDDRVLLDTLDIVNEMASRAQYAFFPDIHPHNVDFRGRIIAKPNVYWLFLDRTAFSMDLPYCGINKTVTNVGLQILAYLGFTEIYLLGMDMTYSVPQTAVRHGVRDVTATEDDDESHFDPRYFGKGRKFHMPILEETMMKFREARSFFTTHGVHVVNATKGGRLDEFPRVDFEEVFAVSDEHQVRKFVANVRGRLRPGQEFDVAAALRLSITKRGSVVPADTRVFRTPAGDAQAWIKETISNFVPFGPVDDHYLFVSRDSLRSVDAARLDENRVGS